MVFSRRKWRVVAGIFSTQKSCRPRLKICRLHSLKWNKMYPDQKKCSFFPENKFVVYPCFNYCGFFFVFYYSVNLAYLDLLPLSISNLHSFFLLFKSKLHVCLYYLECKLDFYVYIGSILKLLSSRLCFLWFLLIR